MGEHNSFSVKAPAKSLGKSRPTIDDVAKLAGLSRTTVSFVVNGREDMRISAEATDRVRRAVKQLGYRPNAVALALRSSQTRSIAMISDSIATNEYAGQMVRGALESAQSYERLLVIAETNADPVLEREFVKGLIDRHVDGFIYATESTRTIQLPDVLANVPCVLLNCIDQLGVTQSFVPDDRLAGQIAAESLLSVGHGSGIYFVGMPMPDFLASSGRIAGASETLILGGAKLAGVVPCHWWPEAAYASVLQLLKRSGKTERPRAFICINDRVAFGAYQALADVGLNVPEDVSVVSFDGSLLANWLRPRLTSIAIPQRDLGAAAVTQLVAMMGGETESTESTETAETGRRSGSPVTYLAPSLIVRDSIVPPTDQTPS